MKKSIMDSNQKQYESLASEKQQFSSKKRNEWSNDRSKYLVYRGSRNQSNKDTFLKRQQEHMESKRISMMNLRQGQMVEDYEVPFAERLGKHKMRDFQNNTRMNIKNREYFEQSFKRERIN